MMKGNDSLLSCTFLLISNLIFYVHASNQMNGLSDIFFVIFYWQGV